MRTLIALLFIGAAAPLYAAELDIPNRCRAQMYRYCPKSFTATPADRLKCITRHVSRVSTTCRQAYAATFKSIITGNDASRSAQQPLLTPATSMNKGKIKTRSVRTHKSAHSELLGRLLLFTIAFSVFIYISCMWRLFSLSGYPGWYCLVPGLNLYVFVEISGHPGWWLALFLIPGVNILVYVMISISLAESRGRTRAFGFGLATLPLVFYPMLVFE